MNRTARNRPRADRAERTRVVRNRSERTRVARDRAERTRVVRIRAKSKRVIRDRAEHIRVARIQAKSKRVIRDRAERTRFRYASVRAFVERLNAQPYELLKPRHRPPLSSRQFSLSTRVYRCLTNSILSTPVQPLPHWQYFSTRVQSLSRQRFSLSTRHALPSQLLSGCLCLINSCRPSVAGYPLSDRCCPSPVVSALLPFSRCRAVGWKGIFALCVAFSTDEWTRSGNESVELEMDLVESRFVESRWK